MSTPNSSGRLALMALLVAGACSDSPSGPQDPPANPVAPTVETLPAMDITTTGMQINGSVNPNNGSTTYTFHWGAPGSDLPEDCGESPTLTGGQAMNVSCTLSNLVPGLPIAFRVSAENEAGSAVGSTLTDQLLSAPPTVETLPPQEIDSTGGLLPFSVRPNGLQTSANVEYGTTANLGQTCGGDLTVPPTTWEAFEFFFGCRVTEFSPGTQVFYRGRAENADGLTLGEIRSFTTASSSDRSPAGAPPALRKIGAAAPVAR